MGLRHEHPGHRGPGDHRAGLRGARDGTPRQVPHRICAHVSRADAGEGKKSGGLN